MVERLYGRVRKGHVMDSAANETIQGLDYRNSKRQVLNINKVSLKFICVHAYLLFEIYSVGNVGFQK